EAVVQQGEDEQWSLDSQEAESSASTLCVTSPAQVAPTATRKARSWVFVNGWAVKNLFADGKTEQICCKFPRCTAAYANQKGSTSNISVHLKDKHKINPSDINDETFVARKGPMDRMLAKGSKRSADEFSPDEFSDALLMFIVSDKQSFTIVHSPRLQRLLILAHQAPSAEFLKLPSNDTISRR
ncbi:hypothetical protein EC968_009887, partial [Mortierella alpina]